MWICPECKNKNIDNSSVCLKCFKGRMCSNCENPSAEAVCPYCNADSRKETWVSEGKYAAYTATINSSVGDPASVNNVSGNHKADNSTGKITPLPESDVKSEGALKTSSKTDKTGAKNNKASKKKSKSSFKAGLTAMLALVFTAGIVFAVYEYIYLPGQRESAVVHEGIKSYYGSGDEGSENDLHSDGISGMMSDAQPEAGSDIASDMQISSDMKIASDATSGATGSDAILRLPASTDVVVPVNPPSKAPAIKAPAGKAPVVVQQPKQPKGGAQAPAGNSDYQKAAQNLNSGNLFEAYKGFMKLGGGSDSYLKLTEIAGKASAYLSAGSDHSAGVRKNGTVVAVGNNDFGKSDICNWTGVAGISVNGYHSVGLKKDGTLIASGWNGSGQCNVGGFKNITEVSAGVEHTLARTSAGTVVAVGSNKFGQCNVASWSGVKAVAAGSYHSVALRNDGTVVAVGNNEYGQCNVSGWRNIVQVSAGDRYTVGVKSDGTVVVTGDNFYSQQNVKNWKNIMYISAGYSHIVGITRDGKAVATGTYYAGEIDVSGWNNIVTVSAGKNFTLALRSDGTVLSTGDNSRGQCLASGWIGIGS